MKYYNNYGFSLYQLIIILAVAGSIMHIAISSLARQFINNNGLIAFMQLQAVIKYAQQEAIRQRSNEILICPANFNINGILSGDFCNTLDGKWDKGALVFRSLNGSSSYQRNSSGRIAAIRLNSPMQIILHANNSNFATNKLRVNNAGEISDDKANTSWKIEFKQNLFDNGVCKTANFNQYGVFSSLSEC